MNNNDHTADNDNSRFLDGNYGNSLFDESDNDKPLKWYQKAFWTVAGAVAGGFMFRYMSVRKSWRDRLRYFRPTVHEGILFRTTSWEMRDKPLEDPDLDELEKAKFKIIPDKLYSR